MTRGRGLRRVLVAASVLIALGVPLGLAWRTGIPLTSVLHLPLRAHLLAGLVMSVEVTARAARLMALAPALRLPLRWRTAVLSQLAADAAGAITPARSGSEPAKLITLRRDGGGLGSVGALAAGEMVFEVAGLGIVALALTLGLGAGARTAGGVLLYAGVVLTILLLLEGLGRRADPLRRAPRRWLWLGLGRQRWRALLRAAHDFHAHFVLLKQLRGRAVAGALAATLVHQAARAAVLPALLLGSLTRPDTLDVIPWVPVTVVPFTLLYLGALLPAPGGGGGVELAFAALLGDALEASRLPALLLWWRAWTHHATALAGGLAIVVIAGRRRIG